MNTLYVLIKITLVNINYGKPIPTVSDVIGNFNTLEECRVELDDIKKSNNTIERRVDNNIILIIKNKNIINFFSCNQLMLKKKLD